MIKINIRGHTQTTYLVAKGIGGVPQKTTTVHNSYLVKVATLGGEGVKILKKWLRGLCMVPNMK